MVKRTGGLKGCKHYDSKSIAHYRNGGEVGGIGGGSGVDGSGTRGNGGYGGGTSGNQGGGGMGGGGKGGVRGTGLTTSTVTGTKVSGPAGGMARRPEAEKAGMYQSNWSMPNRVRAKKPAAPPPKVVPVGYAPPAPKPVAPRLTGFPGGYGVQAYEAYHKQSYDRVPQDPNFTGNTFDQNTRQVGVSGKDQSRIR